MRDTPLILIIEDEEDILELEEFHLQNAGFETIGLLSSKGVRDILEEEDIDLMVVDRNLPQKEGSELVAELREEGIDIPVIFVTAKDSDKDVEDGFIKGGDDYLKKPFNMNELVLRVKALLKRGGKFEYSNIIKYKSITMDISGRRVEIEGKEIPLTKLEFELLKYFLKSKGRVVTRDELLDEVWRDSEDIGYKSVNIAVNRLKKKIEKDIDSELYISSVRSVGYKLC